jgi:polyferredoxin
MAPAARVGSPTQKGMTSCGPVRREAKLQMQQRVRGTHWLLRQSVLLNASREPFGLLTSSIWLNFLCAQLIMEVDL